MSALELVMMKRVGELNSEVRLLKSELNNCYTAIRVKDEENARLKAEVEAMTTSPASRLLRASRAEVESLRKAGTEMGKYLPDTDEANRAYIDFEAGGKQP